MNQRRTTAHSKKEKAKEILMLEVSWNVMAHAQKPGLVFRRNDWVHLNRRGRQFSRLLAAELRASAVVMLDTPCSQVVWRVLATHCIRKFPLHFPPLRHRVSSNFNWSLTSKFLKLFPSLKYDDTRWRREGKWRGNWRMEWVASTLHITSEHVVSSITTADVHTLAASSRLNWRPRRFKWTRPFRRKTKSGFCACAITFQLASTTWSVISRTDVCAYCSFRLSFKRFP
jgi:hypothetical protein